MKRDSRWLYMDQGTQEWHDARVYRVTASRMNEVMGRLKNGQETAKRASYRVELLSQRLTGQVADHYVSKAMEHGTETEPFARTAYELATEQMVDRVGFVVHPAIADAGASPDGVLEDGILEIKCPETKTHIDWACAGVIPDEHRDQMQWQMACTGAAWCDFVSFDDRLPKRYQLFIVRLPRDDGRIAELEDGVRLFLKEVDAAIAALEARFPALPEPLHTHIDDLESLSITDDLIKIIHLTKVTAGVSNDA